MIKTALLLACVDGRYILPTIWYVKKHLLACSVDVMTEPGMDLLLSNQRYQQAFQTPYMATYAKLKADFIQKFHPPDLVVIAGHEDCHANHGDFSHHHTCLYEAKNRLERWFPHTQIFRLYAESGLILDIN